jgi:molecular chaperone DnaK (HSP70)
MTFPDQPPPRQIRIQTWKIGLDLGSTFSAAAYCLTSETTDNCTAGEVRTVQGYKAARWNRSDTLRRREVPTKVRYEAGGNVRCGWDAARLAEKGLDSTIPGFMIDLFKPGLDHKEETRDERRHIEELLVQLQSEFSLTKTVDDVVADFVESLLRHVKDQLEPCGYRDDDSVQLTCTVPAMWSAKAKRRTVAAVKKAADLCRLRLDKHITVLSEPEAATAYVVRKNDRLQFKVVINCPQSPQPS